MYNNNFNIIIEKQSSFSAGNAFLRAFFRGIMIIPWLFVTFFLSIYLLIMMFVNFFTTLFSGKIDQNYHNLLVNWLNLALRFDAWSLGMRDVYPSTGLSFRDEKLKIEVVYDEKYSIGNLLLRSFLITYALIIHYIIFLFVSFVSSFVSFFAFFGVIFTGSYPDYAYNFNRNFLAWYYYITAYSIFPANNWSFPPFAPEEYKSPSQD